MANTIEIKKLYNILKKAKNVKSPDNPNKTVDFETLVENDFIKKMESKDGRNNFFKRYWTVLNNAGINLGKYNDYEKKYGGTTTQTTKLSLEKLLDIDDRFLETNDPNQVVRYYKTQDKEQRVAILYSNGRWISRKDNVNNKVGQISGYWNFVGDDNYQMKWSNNGETKLYDFKTGKTTKVSGEAPPSLEDVAQKQKEDAKTKLDAEREAKLHPTLKKLMDIDSDFNLTSSPNQLTWYFQDSDSFWIMFSNGYWLNRDKSINNANGEGSGKWYFDGDDNYKIIDNTLGYIFDFKTRKWTKIKKPFKWNEVKFTLDDVLKGNAVLKRGDKGPAVKELQNLMIKMNLSKVSKSGQADGYYGKLTELSIRQFQGEMKRGERDGKVGKKTLSRMLYVYNYDPDKEVDDVETPKTAADYLPKDVPSDALNPELPPEELQENIKKIVSKILKEHKN